MNNWSKLPCDQQHDLATKIAANVGYKLVPEDSIQSAEDRADDREAISNLVKAWDSLKTGYYSKDIVETWLVDKMKPAIERARSLMGARSR